MSDENPFAAPTASVVERPELPSVDLSAQKLRLNAWLTVAEALGTIVLLFLVVMGSWQEQEQLLTYSNWLGAALALLGCYLLFQLRELAERLFQAQRLGRVVWFSVLGSVVYQLLMLTVEASTGELDWSMVVSIGSLPLMGVLSLWLGIRLLQVENVYPSFRLMAWLDIASGVLLLLILPGVLAPLPLIGAMLCQAAVFFRAAAELPTAD